VGGRYRIRLLLPDEEIEARLVMTMVGVKRGDKDGRVEKIRHVSRWERARASLWAATALSTSAAVTGSPLLNTQTPRLRCTPAKTRFLSLEPLLGPLGRLKLAGIHWVIAGGESGPGARDVEPEWVRSIRDQCNRQKVPFHFKQWGGVNKKKAGRKLDGRTWDEFPRTVPA
jgi:protein gp37